MMPALSSISLPTGATRPLGDNTQVLAAKRRHCRRLAEWELPQCRRRWQWQAPERPGAAGADDGGGGNGSCSRRRYWNALAPGQLAARQEPPPADPNKRAARPHCRTASKAPSTAAAERPARLVPAPHDRARRRRESEPAPIAWRCDSAARRERAVVDWAKSNRRSPVGSMRGPCQVAQPGYQTTLPTSASTKERKSPCGVPGHQRRHPCRRWWVSPGNGARMRGDSVRGAETGLRGRAKHGKHTLHGGRDGSARQSTSLLKRTAWGSKCWQNATPFVDFSHPTRSGL